MDGERERGAEGCNVLVVDDEPNVCRLVEVYLTREGLNVRTAHAGCDALRLHQELNPDLVLLDVMLPGIDGWEVCRRIRAAGDTPVIMLTARDSELDRVLGLELGADDYVTKPFSPRELVLRVLAVLRRCRGRPADECLEFPGLVLDGRQRTARLNGEEISLTRREFDLLWHLARHSGTAFERHLLIERIWGFDFTGDERTVDVHITRLREKIQPPGSSRRYLHTVWGVGYKFEVREGAS